MIVATSSHRRPTGDNNLGNLSLTLDNSSETLAAERRSLTSKSLVDTKRKYWTMYGDKVSQKESTENSPESTSCLFSASLHKPSKWATMLDALRRPSSRQNALSYLTSQLTKPNVKNKISKQINMLQTHKTNNIYYGARNKSLWFAKKNLNLAKKRLCCCWDCQTYTRGQSRTQPVCTPMRCKAGYLKIAIQHIVRAAATLALKPVWKAQVGGQVETWRRRTDLTNCAQPKISCRNLGCVIVSALAQHLENHLGVSGQDFSCIRFRARVLLCQHPRSWVFRLHVNKSIYTVFQHRSVAGTAGTGNWRQSWCKRNTITLVGCESSDTLEPAIWNVWIPKCWLNDDASNGSTHEHRHIINIGST